MKKMLFVYALIALAVVFLILFVIKERGINDDWKVCEVDNECMVVQEPSLCGERYIAINERYSFRFNVFHFSETVFNKMKWSYVCSTVGKIPPDFARCNQEGVCVGESYENSRLKLKEELIVHCEEQCTQAQNNDCSVQALAELCVSGSHQIFREGEFIDYNRDRTVSYDLNEFGGEGVCEDQIYCFTQIRTCCGQQLTVERCSAILAQVWPEDTTQRNDLCSTFNKGSCELEEDGWEHLAWWNNEQFSGPDGLCPGFGSN